HTASDAGLLGGNVNPTPGEISLAHHGVLFLDELPEFKRSVLETLRQPVEEGRGTISRAAGTVTFPSQFMLVAAMNPTPDGKMPGESRCSPREIQNYLNRISGPLLDRIDIHVEVPGVKLSPVGSKGTTLGRNRSLLNRPVTLQPLLRLPCDRQRPINLQFINRRFVGAPAFPQINKLLHF